MDPTKIEIGNIRLEYRLQVFLYIINNKFSFIPNEIRNFGLKFCNAKILLNSQIAHFNPEVSPMCSFCAWYPTTNPHREDFFHFFFDCRFVRNLLERYFDNIFGDPIDIPKLFLKAILLKIIRKSFMLTWKLFYFAISYLMQNQGKKFPVLEQYQL